MGNERSRATGRAAYALRHGSERVSGSKPEEMSLMIVFSIDFMSHRLRGERSSGSREGARAQGRELGVREGARGEGGRVAGGLTWLSARPPR